MAVARIRIPFERMEIGRRDRSRAALDYEAVWHINHGFGEGYPDCCVYQFASDVYIDAAVGMTLRKGYRGFHETAPGEPAYAVCYFCEPDFVHVLVCAGCGSRTPSACCGAGGEYAVRMVRPKASNTSREMVVP